jgi:Tfp pilus assembly protein PilV
MKSLRRNGSHGQAGTTLLEMMIAVTVLAIGLGGAMALVSMAIASNNRNKHDTTATMLSQMVMEQILAAGANASSTFTITDCQGNSFTIDPTGSSTGRGAPITASTGDINFASAISPSTGYNMNYTVCRAAGQTATYDVRWNIQTLSTASATVYTKQISVAARPLGAAGTGSSSLLYFAIPVTLRGVAGNYPN